MAVTRLRCMQFLGAAASAAAPITDEAVRIEQWGESVRVLAQDRCLLVPGGEWDVALPGRPQSLAAWLSEHDDEYRRHDAEDEFSAVDWGVRL